MRAVGFRHSLPVEDAQALIEEEVDKPAPQRRDLLVAVKAVSVNPVDTKQRKRIDPQGKELKVLGYDAAGIVAEVGPDATLFKPGDEVWYAGSIIRPGTNAEFHLVDERIVGRKPRNLSFAEAAALPLTAITAWEMLFDRLAVAPGGDRDRALLLVGGAGGVGSIAIQLACCLTALTVVATASRPETTAWCRELGAHHVIDHTQPFAAQLKSAGISAIDYVFGITHSDDHFDQIVEVIAPQGKFGLIDDPKPFEFAKLKRKSASLHWEAMFTRSMFETPDMIAQHQLLNEVAAMVEAGAIRTTLAENLGRIDAANLRRAHAMIESGRTRGKIVLEGF